jgi:hypothetical protein
MQLSSDQLSPPREKVNKPFMIMLEPKKNGVSLYHLLFSTGPPSISGLTLVNSQKLLLCEHLLLPQLDIKMP